ncbi:hypothetical protein EDD18DRAFT_1344591 [Armillaria luteobubalina]|uniref:Uncharacterized protein n=1 Tax=Armillaria luteobubalina TaxID=153913 RepID=A0AA39V368_9AGAR|nr:hypothetical protein EDD18DRAFT_1344591 [Armillaria luteobubalina]
MAGTFAVATLDNEADDFPSVSRLLPTVACPAIKVAGTQHSDPKGKQRADVLLPVASSKLVKKCKAPNPELLGSQTEKKKGRKEGAGNYHSNDLDMLRDIPKMQLPLGDVPHEQLSLLKPNSNSLSKPASRLEMQNVLHMLIKLMNNKAGSCDLDDDEIIDVDNDHKSSDEENIPAKKSTILVQPPIQGPVTCCSATDHLTNSVNTGPHQCNNAQDILQNISSVLSPDAQLACSEEFSTHLMQTTQIFTLTALNWID